MKGRSGDRRASVGSVEGLERRALLHGLGHEAAAPPAVAGVAPAELFARVNFQPGRAAVPEAYAADAGLPFGDRGNGLAFGWDADNRHAARDRNSALSPDQRYDTITHTQLYGTRTWELVVPAGTYTVRVVAGDPSAYNSTYGFDVEGEMAVSGKPASAARWVEGAITLPVTDGRLTVSNSAGAVNNKLAFLEVWKVPDAQPAATVTVAAVDATAAETAEGVTRNPGRFRFTRTGPTAEALVVNYTLGGTAAAGADFATPSGRVTIGAGSSSASVFIYPKADALAEWAETVVATVAAGTGYAAGAPAAAAITIADAQPPAGPAPAVEQWKTHAPSPVDRFEAASAAIGGRLYVFGGFDEDIFAMSRADVYDPATDRWTRIGDMPLPLTHAGVANDGRYVYFAGGFVGERSYDATARVLRYDAAADAWSDLTPLPEARGAGGLVLVGRMLHFFGGADSMHMGDYGDHWTLDLDDPAGGWAAAAPLPNPRNHFGYALLDGRIYAIGGQHLKDERAGNQDDVHAYDLATGRWQRVADLPFARSHNHTATVVFNGRIVIVGGQANAAFPRTIADVISFDPAANTWVALPPLPDVRQASAVQVIDGRLYVSTGTPRGIHPQATTWSRQLGNVWDAAPAAPLALGEVAAGMIRGKLYVVGDASATTLAYDVTKGTWSSATALAERPYPGDHHAAEVIGGKFYLFGGLGDGAEGRVQVYDPARNRWSLGAPMPFAVGASTSAVIGGKVYVAGGIIGSSTSDRLAAYDPQTNTWQELARMPAGRNHAAGGTDGRRFYVFGGRGAGSGDGNSVANGFDTVQVYDPATNTWASSGAAGSTLRPLPQARGGMGRAVFHNGEFYVIGGETGTGGGGATADRVYHRVDVYHPSKNTWRLGTPMPTARHGIAPVLFAGRIYVAAGGTRAGASASAVLEVLNPV